MEKQNTIRRLPGSPDTYLYSLNSIFVWVKNNQPVSIMSLAIWIRNNIGWPSSYGQAAFFIRKIFLKKTANSDLILSEWANQWHSIIDYRVKEELMFEFLSDRIFYFEEIVDLVKAEPKSAEDILDIASNQYPKWTTPSVIRDRLDWLLACGIVYMKSGKYCSKPIVDDDKDSYVKQYIEQQSIGEKGEQFALMEEKRQLSGYPSLSKRVRRISAYSPRAGYDIQSYFPDGRLKFIEVKTTTGESHSFEITDTEWQMACKLQEDYFIYRITGINDENPTLKVICNPANALKRKPLVYRAYYESSIEQPDKIPSENTKENRIDSAWAIDFPKKIEYIVEDKDFRRPNNISLSLTESPFSIDMMYCSLCSREIETFEISSRSTMRRGNIWNIELCSDCLLKLMDLLL